MAEENPYRWSFEKLRRKRDQAWEMAGLARQDGDKANEARHTANARLYSQIIYDILMGDDDGIS